MKIIGYHGTTVENAKSIVENGFKVKAFKQNPHAKNNLPGDLGSGIYAFEGDLELAKSFSEKFHSKENIAIIELLLYIEDENLILDFDDEDNLKQFLEVKKRVLKQAKRYFRNCKGNRRCIDGIIVEILMTQLKLPYKLVRKKTYTPLLNEHIDTFSGSVIPLISNYYNGTELCIRDTGIINQSNILDKIED